MPDVMTIDFDAELMLRQLERLGSRADATIDEVSLETANRVADAARTAIRRRTGETAGKIHVERSRYGSGWVVLAYDTGGKGKGGRTRQHHVDLYLEFGTKFMVRSPFLFPAARAIESDHLSRTARALQELCDEVNT